MTRDYSIGKIKEALHATRGNATKARQLITAQAMEDPKLLRELVKPHMVGIVAHAVSRVVSGKTEAEPISQPQFHDEDDDGSSFGLDILKTIAGGDTLQFGQESYGRPVKKQGASQAHIDAIQQMIKKSKE